MIGFYMKCNTMQTWGHTGNIIVDTNGVPNIETIWVVETWCPLKDHTYLNKPAAES